MAVVVDRRRSFWLTPLVAVVFVLAAPTVAVVGVMGPVGPVMSVAATGAASPREHPSTGYDYDALGVARSVAGVRPPADGAVSPALSGARDAQTSFAQNRGLATQVTLRDGTAGLRMRIQTKVPVVGGGTRNVGGYWTTDDLLVTFWD